MVAEARAAFTFLQQLAAEVSRGEVELPSLPDVVIKVRQTLDAADFDVAGLAQVVSAEPALAGRIVALANSALFHRGNRPVTDVRTAITRIGSEMVRSTAISFALDQLQRAGRYREVGHLLKAQSERSVKLAGLCYALAARERGFPAEEGLLLGLVHNVGALYIISRASDVPGLVDDEADLGALCAEWHPGVGQAIAESWGLAEDICRAVGQQQNPEPGALRYPNLTAFLVEALELHALLELELPPDPAWLAESALSQRLLRDGAAADALLAEVKPVAEQISAGLRL